jgi:hypothetical protein
MSGRRKEGSTVATEIVPAPEGAEIETPSGLATFTPEVQAAYEPMLMLVPEASGDGFESILMQIAAANDVSELDAPWRSDGLARFIDSPLRFDSIRRLPSDFESGIGWYLIAEAVDRSTGERVTLTTGALSVVAQLVRAWALGQFPVNATPRRAKNPTAAGFYPVHLQIDRAAR